MPSPLQPAQHLGDCWAASAAGKHVSPRSRHCCCSVPGLPPLWAVCGLFWWTTALPAGAHLPGGGSSGMYVWGAALLVCCPPRCRCTLWDFPSLAGLLRCGCFVLPSLQPLTTRSIHWCCSLLASLLWVFFCLCYSLPSPTLSPLISWTAGTPFAVVWYSLSYIPFGRQALSRLTGISW